MCICVYLEKESWNAQRAEFAEMLPQCIFPVTTVPFHFPSGAGVPGLDGRPPLYPLLHCCQGGLFGPWVHGQPEYGKEIPVQQLKWVRRVLQQFNYFLKEPIFPAQCCNFVWFYNEPIVVIPIKTSLVSQMGQTVESDDGIQLWPATVVMGTQGPLKPSHPTCLRQWCDATVYCLHSWNTNFIFAKSLVGEWEATAYSFLEGTASHRQIGDSPLVPGGTGIWVEKGVGGEGIWII